MTMSETEYRYEFCIVKSVDFNLINKMAIDIVHILTYVFSTPNHSLKQRWLIVNAWLSPVSIHVAHLKIQRTYGHPLRQIKIFSV